MPLGKGYFIDLRNWELISVAEHYHAIRVDPKRYRVTLGELPRDRDRAIAKVLERDFARVRATADEYYWHVEVDKSWDDAYAAALTVGRAEKLPKYATFRLSVVKDPKRSPREMSFADVVRETLGERTIRARGFHLLVERAYEKKTWDVSVDKAVDLATMRSRR